MRALIFFVLLVAIPLLFLWQHARCFDLCQRLAYLQEKRQRAIEINDSLAARLSSLSSAYGIELRAMALGLEPKVKGVPLLTPRLATQPPAFATASVGFKSSVQRAGLGDQDQGVAQNSSRPRRSTQARERTTARRFPADTLAGPVVSGAGTAQR